MSKDAGFLTEPEILRIRLCIANCANAGKALGYTHLGGNIYIISLTFDAVGKYGGFSEL